MSEIKQPKVLISIVTESELGYGSEITLPSGPSLKRSPLGPLVAGKLKAFGACRSKNDASMMVAIVEDHLNNLFRQFWKLEFTGVTDSSNITDVEVA